MVPCRKGEEEKGRATPTPTPSHVMVVGLVLGTSNLLIKTNLPSSCTRKHPSSRWLAPLQAGDAPTSSLSAPPAAYCSRSAVLTHRPSHHLFLANPTSVPSTGGLSLNHPPGPMMVPAFLFSSNVVMVPLLSAVAMAVLAGVIWIFRPAIKARKMPSPGYVEDYTYQVFSPSGG